MNKKSVASLSEVLCVGVFLFGFVSTVNAALISRLGGLAYYDTDLNITWLADANYAKTSGHDADGLMNWADANTWASSLNIGGVTGWRLPTTLQPDSSCDGQSGGVSSGFNCTGSEMGHLFYTELGGTAGSSILASGDPDLALFSNIQSNPYWSGTEYAPDPSDAWVFFFNNGNQRAGLKDSGNLFAWAVHSGDVGASSVPEPGTVALMGLGLMGLLGLGRRQRRR